MRVEMNIEPDSRFIYDYVIGRKNVIIHYVVPWTNERGVTVGKHFEAIGDVVELIHGKEKHLVVKTKFGTFRNVKIDEIAGVYDNDDD